LTFYSLLWSAQPLPGLSSDWRSGDTINSCCIVDAPALGSRTIRPDPSMPQTGDWAFVTQP
jgi:hypothetical protein